MIVVVIIDVIKNPFQPSRKKNFHHQKLNQMAAELLRDGRAGLSCVWVFFASFFFLSIIYERFELV
jgi:hypothetical protein